MSEEINLKRHAFWYILLFVLSLFAIVSFVFLSKFNFSKTYAEKWDDYLRSEELITEINSEEDYLKLAESLYRGYQKRLEFNNEYFDTQYAEKLYDGAYVTLNTDIDFEKLQKLCENKDVLPLREFSGIFDGKGHEIKNIVIRDESVATLFYDLYGTVANLSIAEDSIFDAPVKGSITNCTFSTGRIVNCKAVTVDNDTEIAANNILVIDSVINCCGNTDSITSKELNDAIGTFTLTNSPKSYMAWEESADGPRLTGNEIVSLSDCSTSLENWGVIKAFFSEEKQCWMFVLPSDSLADTDHVDTFLKFTNGKELRLSLPADGKMVSIISPSAGDNEISLNYSFSVCFTDSIPVMSINTNSDNGLSYLGYSKKNALTAEYCLRQTDSGFERGIIDEIRGHGNHSWQFGEKRSFNITLGNSTKLCGLDESCNYALISGERYNSLFSYMVTSEIARRVQMPGAPDTEFVHLYVDGNYLGVYFLTPKIEISENRINIKDIKLDTQKINSKPLNEYELEQYYTEGDAEKRMGYLLEKNPKDVTGGFIFELNSRDFEEKDARFRTRDNHIFVVRSMPYGSLEMVNSLADSWSEFEEACDSPNGINSKGKHYTEYIDPRSFALQWLMLDFNLEYSIGSSIYFYKDSDLNGDSRFYAVYPWDVEHSFLEDSDSTILMDEEFLADERDYWRWYLKHPEFLDLASSLWHEVMLPELNEIFESANPKDSELFKKYEADLLVNQYRWKSANPIEKYAKIHNFAKERMDVMTERLG